MKLARGDPNERWKMCQYWKLLKDSIEISNQP